MSIQPEQINKASADIFTSALIDAGEHRNVWLSYFIPRYEESGSVDLACREATQDVKDTLCDEMKVARAFQRAVDIGVISFDPECSVEFSNVRRVEA